MTASAPATFPCPRCGVPLFDGQLACPNCGSLVYARQLNDIAASAAQEEQSSPTRAAMIWREALPLIPAGAPQRQMVLDRIAALQSGATIPPLGGAPRPIPRNDPLRVAIVKTVGSMIVSIIVYAFMFSSEGMEFALKFATGFVLLILVHELGHVVAMKYYGYSASPPIFIPFVGAVINLRQPPRNALEEAVVGIGGPVFGAIGATVAFIIFMNTGWELWFELAQFGFLLNLFNMMPVPPLDGGRVTAAVNPWLWIAGLALAAIMVVSDYINYHRVDFIIVLLLIMAWPRVKAVLQGRVHKTPYYQIGKLATWGMGTAYVLLGGYLAVMYYLPQILLWLRRAG